MRQSDFLDKIKPFTDKIYRLAKRLLVSSDEAQDATQDILLKLWDNKKQIKNIDNIEAYSMTITKNHCLDRLKSKQAQHLRIVHTNYKSNDTPVHREMELKDDVQWVSNLIEKLPEQQRLVIHLRDIEQFELEEIAEILDITPVNARVTLSRARKTVKQQLLQTNRYGIK